MVNDDINESLTILRKSKVVSLEALYHKNILDTLVIIRLI